jgi:G3E family GTPase
LTAAAPATNEGAAPVTVITGFLGSGKTTLLNRLLSDPGMADTAVVINEFGEISIDHLLVETSIENTLLLQNGCICCTIRGDLVDTLSDLMTKRRAGLIPPFSRVAIETTGLADPAPILQTLATDPLIAPLFKLKAVIVTVDAVNGPKQLDAFPEAMKQVALADIALVTKTDLPEAAVLGVVSERLREINPSVAVLEVSHGAIKPDDLFGYAPSDPKAGPEELSRWLQFDAFDHDHDRDHTRERGHHHHGDPNRHGDNIHAYAVTLDQPISSKGLELWLNSLLSLRGQDLLRVKGVLNVTGEERPVILHAVQHLVHPVSYLSRWPDDERRSRIVFIVRNISRKALVASLSASIGAPVPA